MCKISKKLKLCTCNNSEELGSETWSYYRLEEGKNLYLVGEIKWLRAMDPQKKRTQKSIICRMLNKSNCFDIEMQHKEGDILEIIFKVDDENMAIHRFLFSYNKWKTCHIDSFEISRQRNLIKQGNIVNGLINPLNQSDFVNDIMN